MGQILKFCLIGALGCCLASLAHATTIDTILLPFDLYLFVSPNEKQGKS
jgi:hypothetical protein